MDPFDVYKIYLALKLHFTTDSYDITKHKYAAKGRKDTFLKRKDLIVIRKLARDFSRQEIIDILVANFVRGDKWGGVFDGEAIDTWTHWKAKKERIQYTFEQDLYSIHLRMEKDNMTDATQGDHPLILKMLMGQKIALETVVILNKHFNFCDDYKDDLVLSDLCLLVRKYTPFIGKKSTVSLLTKHETLINNIARNRNVSYTT